MRLALYQANSPAGDISAGLKVVEQALADAAQVHADMLTMPEIFIPGYASTTATKPEGWDDVHARLSEMCAKHKVALTIGLAEYETDAVYNSAYTFDADGEVICKYRKIQLFGEDEKALYKPGNRYETFEYKGVKFGVLICYDVEFPEHVRALANRGVEVILGPTANMMPYVNSNLIMIPSRALENGLTIVYANYCGSEAHLDYVGLSTICGPDGYSIASKGQSPGLIVAELPNGWSERDIQLYSQREDLVPLETIQ